MVILDSLANLATPIATIAGAIYAVIRINKHFDKSRAKRDDKVLQDAKETAEKVKLELNNELEKLKSKITTLEANVAKDIEHVKETQESEIKYLAEKIEDLRSQLTVHHGQLVAFLTRLVEKD